MTNEETKKEDSMEIEKKEETPEEKLEREKKEAFDMMISGMKTKKKLKKKKPLRCQTKHYFDQKRCSKQ